MHHLALAISAFVLFLGLNLWATGATAAAVNCSYDVCLKECVKNSSSNSCSKWCSDTLMERKNTGQCKK